MPTNEKQESKKEDQKVEESKTPDVQAAERSGLSEGEIKALRDDSGLNGLPGHEANVAAWEASDEGKAFLKSAKERDEAATKAAEDAHKPLDKDGKSEAVKEYEEKVEG